MQGPHQGDDHHPPRLRRALLAAAALAALAPAHAAAAVRAALPSPVAQLTAAPPLAGGAAASTENVRHRIDATTAVRVTVDGAGRPFRVVATQRLDVRVLGDYFFTIGAPVLAVRPAAGSEARPGLRATSILWAGFDPGRRTLAARATLDPAAAAPFLPLRVERTATGIRLVNATAVATSAYSAPALRAPLLRYAATVRAAVLHGRLPPPGNALLTGPPRSVRLRVSVPLHVSGTIGGRRFARVVESTALVAGGGRIELAVSPVDPAALVPDLRRVPDGELVVALSRGLLELARRHQYEQFLGNPDPTGRSSTTYTYVSGVPRAAAPVPAAHRGSHGWARTLLVALGAAAAAGAALAAWARA